MPTRKADVAAYAFAGVLNATPAPLRKALTYDQSKEMADHHSLVQDTGIRDTQSPWQRGANENTHGILQQYFVMSLSSFDQADLDLVAASLNDRPRKTLDFATPEEQFISLLAGLASATRTSPGGFRSGT
jgi:IS30 family transposase